MALWNIKHAYVNKRLMFNFMKKSDIQSFPMHFSRIIDSTSKYFSSRFTPFTALEEKANWTWKGCSVLQYFEQFRDAVHLHNSSIWS